MRVALAGVALLAACGTTTIRAHGTRDAKIYVNGTYAGRGEATIQKRGGAESTTIKVVAADGRSGQTTIRRSFTGKTLLFAFLTYGICLLACKEYPEDVEVLLDQHAAGRAPGAGWDDPGAADPWMTPPPGWQPTTPASQPLAPASQPVAPAPAPPANSW